MFPVRPVGKWAYLDSKGIDRRDARGVEVEVEVSTRVERNVAEAWSTEENMVSVLFTYGHDKRKKKRKKSRMAQRRSESTPLHGFAVPS